MSNSVDKVYESIDTTLKQEADAASFIVGFLESTIEDPLQSKDIKTYADNLLIQLFSYFPVMCSTKRRIINETN